MVARKSKGEKLLAQCPKCKSIKILYTDKFKRWQKSIAVFKNLPQESCIECTSIKNVVTK